MTANVVVGGIDEVFERTDGAGTAVFLTNAQGSTVAVTDATGLVQASYTYEAYGASRIPPK